MPGGGESVEISPLRGYPQLYPQVALWIYAQWPHEFAGVTPEEWQAEFALAQDNGLITSFVALEGGEPLGTASLDLGDLPQRPELSPWLASVYVSPERRGRGLAGRLVARVEQEARRRGHGCVYLHTTDQEAFYARRGWERLERVEAWGLEAVLMRKRL